MCVANLIIDKEELVKIIGKIHIFKPTWKFRIRSVTTVTIERRYLALAKSKSDRVMPREGRSG